MTRLIFGEGEPTCKAMGLNLAERSSGTYQGRVGGLRRGKQGRTVIYYPPI